MFLAISEIAVAMNVASVRVKPSLSASSRPAWRATTVSASDVSRTSISSPTAVARSALEELEASLEVKRRIDRIQAQAEPGHSHGNLGPDPHHDRLCSTELVRTGDGA